MRELEKRASFLPQSHVDVILDEYFFLHLLPELPSTLDLILKKTLQLLCKLLVKEIAFVFETIVTPTIRDTEHGSRTQSEKPASMCELIGPVQKQLHDFLKALQKDSFKSQEEIVFMLLKMLNCVKKEEIPEFFNTHKETDQKINSFKDIFIVHNLGNELIIRIYRLHTKSIFLVIFRLPQRKTKYHQKDRFSVEPIDTYYQFRSKNSINCHQS